MKNVNVFYQEMTDLSVNVLHYSILQQQTSPILCLMRLYIFTDIHRIKKWPWKNRKFYIDHHWVNISYIQTPMEKNPEGNQALPPQIDAVMCLMYKNIVQYYVELIIKISV